MDNIISGLLGVNIDGVELRLLCEKDINEFSAMKVDEMRYHIKYADSLGIEDRYFIEFNGLDAVKDLCDYTTLIICCGDSIIGFIQISDFPYYGSSKSGIKIDNLFIKEEYRSKGIATSIINKFRSEFDNITLELWYGMDTLEKYKHMGFREIGKIMLLD